MARMPSHRSINSSSSLAPSSRRWLRSDSTIPGITAMHSLFSASTSSLSLTQIPWVISMSRAVGARASGMSSMTFSSAPFISDSFSRLMLASDDCSARSSRMASSTFPLTMLSLTIFRNCGSDRFRTSGSLRVRSRNRLLTDLHSMDRFQSPTVMV